MKAHYNDLEYFLAKGIYKNKNNQVIFESNGDEIPVADLLIEHKITIFEKQVKCWFLDKATHYSSKKKPESLFIVLMICLSYPEGYYQYKTGEISKNKSSDFFKYAMNEIFNFNSKQITESVLENIYSQGRCGLFHTGMTHSKIICNYTDTEAILEMNGNLLINPKILLEYIKKHFNDYIQNLRKEENKEIRENFEKMYNQLI